MTDNLHIGQEAREKLMAGVKKISDAIGATMGTSGANSLIETIERPFHWPSNDGWRIANSIKLADPLEDMGRLILVEAINRANKASGDGSSTTAVLTSAILEEGMKHLSEASPMEIKRSLEACIPLIEESIKKQTKEITVDTVKDVASISAESEEIGAKIQEIYQKIGPKGIINWDVSKTAEDYYTIGTGITVNGANYVAPYMADEKGEIRLKNPKILLTKKKLTTGADLNAIAFDLFNKDIKELVIFCDDFDPQVITHFYNTKQARGFNTILVKMPLLWRDEWWEDLQLATGATVIQLGLKLSEVKYEQLGTVENLLITKEDTYIDGFNDLSKHILALQVDGSDQALIRAARLNTQTARYYIGGYSEAAIGQKRDKVEDAINAASCALEHGIIQGGGVALANVASELGNPILSRALFAPYEQILKNAGIKIEPVYKAYSKGFDTRTGKQVNMFEAGIVDPTDVVLNAVKSAIGVAATILTIGTVVTLPKNAEEVRRV